MAPHGQGALPPLPSRAPGQEMNSAVQRGANEYLVAAAPPYTGAAQPLAISSYLLVQTPPPAGQAVYSLGLGRQALATAGRALARPLAAGATLRRARRARWGGA